MIDIQNVHSVLGKRMLVDGYDMVLDIEKSQGMWLHDGRKDRKILDFFGFFASSPVGMNHPRMFDPSFLKRLQYASINKIVNSDIYTTEMAEFVESLEPAIPGYMKYLFFIEGGSPAVENGLKTAFDWKVKKNFLKGSKSEKGHKVIHLKEAFHGRTGYTLSLTNTFDPKKTEYYPKFDWPRVINPKINFPLNKDNLKKVEMVEKQSIEEIENAIEKDGDDIALFIMEPIQGEGGDNHFRKQYFAKVREITEKNDIMFMVDEIQSGMGITGKWWAHEHFDVKPDIISFGKKSQVCGIMVGSRVDEIENNVFRESSRINSTWGGNFTDMVRSTRYMQIILEEKLLENAEKVGSYMVKRLNELQESAPDMVSNVRGRGVMIAMDLKNTAMRDKFTEITYKKGLIHLKCGEKSARFRPPLIVSQEDVDRAMSIMESAVKELQ
ncbi:MAG: L-lysine 6-transaminase [Candidatus Thermoplasmatota archaeon]|nr:L-lysine 6-transaminase [Candidatus Thermoplasmatota archaeon]MCL5963044.1 L-lysine 6-transaminase [Candidatus Thermoplasmatota archaeon]